MDLPPALQRIADLEAQLAAAEAKRDSFSRIARTSVDLARHLQSRLVEKDARPSPPSATEAVWMLEEDHDCWEEQREGEEVKGKDRKKWVMKKVSLGRS